MRDITRSSASSARRPALLCKRILTQHGPRSEIRAPDRPNHPLCERILTQMGTEEHQSADPEPRESVRKPILTRRLGRGRASRMPPHAQRATSTPNQPVHANKPTTTRVTTYTTRHAPTQSAHPTNTTANPACHHMRNTPHQRPAQPTRTNLWTGAMHATTHTTTANARCLTGTLRCSRLAQLGAWRLCHKVGGGRNGQHNITGGVVTGVWYSRSTSPWSSCSSTRPVRG